MSFRQELGSLPGALNCCYQGGYKNAMRTEQFLALSRSKLPTWPYIEELFQETIQQVALALA